MARRVGVFRNIFNSLFRSKQKVTCVGSDEFGNKYFEREADKAHNLRGRRWVEPASEDQVNAIPEVPAGWDAWLRNKRFSPPTPEELEKNIITRLRTQARAKEIEEREQLAYLSDDVFEVTCTYVIVQQTKKEDQLFFKMYINNKEERYQEDEERQKVDANVNDFLKNVTREEERKEFPKYDDLEVKPGQFRGKEDR